MGPGLNQSVTSHQPPVETTTTPEHLLECRPATECLLSLQLPFITYAEFVASPCPPPRKDSTATLGRHPFPEAMCVLPLPFMRLIGSLHGTGSPLNRFSLHRKTAKKRGLPHRGQSSVYAILGQEGELQLTTIEPHIQPAILRPAPLSTCANPGEVLYFSYRRKPPVVLITCEEELVCRAQRPVPMLPRSRASVDNCFP